MTARPKIKEKHFPWGPHPTIFHAPSPRTGTWQPPAPGSHCLSSGPHSSWAWERRGQFPASCERPAGGAAARADGPPRCHSTLGLWATCGGQGGRPAGILSPSHLFPAGWAQDPFVWAWEGCSRGPLWSCRPVPPFALLPTALPQLPASAQAEEAGGCPHPSFVPVRGRFSCCSRESPFSGTRALRGD